jgi:hypothetical protein
MHQNALSQRAESCYGQCNKKLNKATVKLYIYSSQGETRAQCAPPIPIVKVSKVAAYFLSVLCSILNPFPRGKFSENFPKEPYPRSNQ